MLLIPGWKINVDLPKDSSQNVWYVHNETILLYIRAGRKENATHALDHAITALHPLDALFTR